MAVVAVNGKISFHQINQEKAHVEVICGADVTLPNEVTESESHFRVSLVRSPGESLSNKPFTELLRQLRIGLVLNRERRNLRGRVGGMPESDAR